MTAAASNTQAVFMIDVSLCRNGGAKWDEAISLCVFRILNFLHSQLQVVDKTKTKSLRWGYKLFDIDEKGVKVDFKSYGFQDFKLKTFQEFEVILKRCMQQVMEAYAADSDDSQNQHTTKRFLIQSYPSLCLSKRLTEALHDFPWEMPDVVSPIKVNKMKSQFESSEEQSNFVFLISRVPCDRKTLRHFCNKVVMDKHVFVEAFMPQVLQRQFYNKHKIQLLWIDAGRYRASNKTSDCVPAEKKSYDIVKSSLRMVGGLLLPFHSLVTHLTTTAERQQQDNTETSAGESEPEAQTDRRDQVTNIFSSFACMSVCTAMVPSWAGRRAGGGGGWGKSEGSAVCTTNTATLVFEQLGAAGDRVRSVCMKLVPITKKATIESSQTSRGDLQQLKLGTSDDTEAACILVIQSARRPLPHQHPSPSPSTPNTTTPTTRVFHMRACMAKSNVRQVARNLGPHFLCFVLENSPEDQHKVFSSLLQSLHATQQALIMSVTHDKENCPYLAVLEASTGCVAHLTYLSLGLTLLVEKQITLKPGWGDGGRGEDDGESSCWNLSLEMFKDCAANAISVQTAFRQLGKEQEVDCAGSEGCGLWTGVLNPWHMPGSVPNIQSGLDKLSGRRQQDLNRRSQRELQVRRSLTQAYRQANQPPFHHHLLRKNTPLIPSSTPFPFSTTSLTEGSGSFLHDGGGAQRRKSGRHENILTRGRLMVIKARNLSSSSSSLAGDEVDGDCTQVRAPNVPVAPRADIAQADVKSEDDLRQFVRQEYIRSLQTEVNPEPIVHMLISATLRFMMAQDCLCPQREAARFLEEEVLKKHKELKADLTTSQELEEDESDRLKEFKLQAFLRLEIESMCSAVTSIVPAERKESHLQIVALMRSLLFSVGPKFVLDFLNTVVLETYRTTIPQVLVTIYDELMQPLPPELGEEDEATPHKPPTPPSLQPLSVGSTSGLTGLDDISVPMTGGDVQSSLSPRRRTQSSVRAHPSLSGINRKRQIEVKAPAAKKLKGSNGKKGAKGRDRKDRTKSPAKHREKASGKNTARRNLFNTDLCKVSSKQAYEQQQAKAVKKRHHSGSSRHKAQHKTLVAETPRHKHKGRMVWLQRGHDEADPCDDVQVVQESPWKEVESYKSTPGRYKAPRRVLNRSFYSVGRTNSSRTLSRAMENPANISGHHHVADLEDSRPGQLAKALCEDHGMSSSRRRVVALLNPRSSRDTSPELDSPARNTRSRTPQKPKSNSARRHLFEETCSLPTLPSVAKNLDFSTPEKKKQLVKVTSGAVKLLSPSKRKTSSVVTSANLFAGVALDTVTSQILTTSPRMGHIHHTLLVDDTASQQTNSSGCVTPTNKGRQGGSKPRTPKKCPSTLGLSLQARTTLNMEKLGGSASEGKRDSVTTPKKHSRGVKNLKGVSPQGSSNNSSSGSQQSSILDYISPSRKAGHHAQQGDTTRAGIEGSSFLHMHAINGDEKELQPRPRPSYVTTPTKARQAAQSSLRTPTKSGIISLAHMQQFQSPVKTPSKSILKSSPMVGSSRSTPSHNQSITPQKVTFSERTSPSQGSEDEVKSPESMSRGNRKKRRWSGDHGKSPTSSPYKKTSSHSGSGVQVTNSSTEGAKQLVQDCLQDQSSLGFAPVPNPRGVVLSRKRSFVLSEVDSMLTSPPKRQCLDSSEASGISRPALFSENAMDSYFSASNDEIFLSASSSQSSTKQSVVHSPLFKGKGKAPRSSADSHHAFDFVTTSFDSVGGSQGFEVLGSQTRDRKEASPSPTFSTSPTLKRQRVKEYRDKGESCGKAGDYSRHGAVDPNTSGSSHTAPGCRTPTKVGGQKTPGRQSGCVTPLSTTGTPKKRMYSPTVSMSSMAQLIRSPILLCSPDSQQSPQNNKQSLQDSTDLAHSSKGFAEGSKDMAQDMRQPDTGNSSSMKRLSRKKLKM